LARQTVGKPDELKGFFVFYDEIQYLKDWEIHLKSVIDTFLYSKFVGSGSAAAALKKKSQESGAGPEPTNLEYRKVSITDFRCISQSFRYCISS
jgi:hypothetical protein